MAKLTTTDVRYSLPTGETVETKVDVYVSANGQFQIDIPEDLHHTARVVSDELDEKVSKELDENGRQKRRSWDRKDCSRRKKLNEYERKEAGRPRPESDPDAVWRICAPNLNSARLGLREIAQRASDLPDIETVVILYHFGAGAAFAEHKDTGEFAPARGEGGWQQWDNHYVDTTKDGRRNSFGRQHGPITVELEAVVARRYEKPVLNGRGNQYRYEAIDMEDPTLGHWARALNSFKFLSYSLPHPGEGKYSGQDRYRTLPYTEDTARQFHDAMLGLSVTAHRISELFASPENLIEGLRTMALPAPETDT